MSSVRLGVLVALLGSAVGCTHAPWNPFGGWRVVKTKHIAMYTDTMSIYTGTLEPLEIAYASLSASMFRDSNIGRVEVLFLEDDTFDQTLGLLRNGAAIAQLPGEGRIGQKGLLVVHPDSRVPEVAHKLAHLFLYAQNPKAPLWLHEAYASYVEPVAYRQGANGYAEVCLGYLNTSDALMPTEEMFGMNWRHLEESKRIDWYRHTARSILDYFLLGEAGKLRGKLAIFSNKMARGNDSAQSFTQVFPDITVAQFHQKILEYRKDSEVRPRGECPVKFQVPPDRLVDDGKPTIEPVAKEDIERLITQVWMLPNRTGYVDWYPPEMVTLPGVFVKSGATP